MKLFTVLKTGYTTGQVGCTGEYFTLITIEYNASNNSTQTTYDHFHGMYGAEQRVERIMQKAGFENFHTNCNYGKLTRKDIMKSTLSEYEIVKALKEKYNISEA